MDTDCQEWLVQLASGDVRMMTLDELDAAFQAGTVDESTLVRRDGAAKWSKLSDELGDAPEALQAAEPVRPEASASQPIPASTRSMAPVVADISLPEVDARGAGPDVDFDAVHRASRKRRLVVGGVVAAAVIGAFAAVTAVNVIRMQKHAALAAQLLAAPRMEATSDPEPLDSPKAKDDAKKRNVRKARSQGNAQQQQPASDLANTPFKNGGDDHDPLNAKL